jgi:hypothetical protein
MQETYLVSDIVSRTLQTGLQVPAQPFWVCCTVVVVRGPEALTDARMRPRLLRLQLPGPSPDRVRVRLSRQDLENAEECLWPEVTALVPFRDWARLEIKRKVRAPRRHVMTVSTCIFHDGQVRLVN